MSVDKGQSPPITTSPPLAAVPIQSQPPLSSAQPTATTEATASYEDVVSDEILFLATLEALHRSLGTKFMVPRVGGRPLNLHRLFVEVTSRGGLQKVIRDRIWKDVISAFNFPSTITNASFVLRKYYISLLQHYEEVYFFRNKDPIDPITGTTYGSPSASKPSPTYGSPSASKPSQVGTTGAHSTSGKHLADSSSGEVLIDQEPLKQQDPTKIAQQKNSTGLQLPGYPPLELGSWLRGEITGKFENGYLVTAIYGSEKLTGVLYHAHSDGSQSQTLSSSSSGQRRRKRSSHAIEEPSLSKSNSCNLYLDHGVKVNPSLSTEEKKISKQLGDLWNRLTQPSNEDNQETESEG